MLTVLSIYLSIGALFAGFICMCSIILYKKYENGQLDEETREDVEDIIHTYRLAMEVLGDRMTWLVLFIADMLFWLPILVVKILEDIMEFFKKRKGE